MTNDIEPLSVLVRIWLLASGIVDEDEVDLHEISELRAERLQAIAKVIRDYVHPSHWPAFEARARALERALLEEADPARLS